MNIDAVTFTRIIRLVSKEYESVCIAQMTDVSKSAKTKEDILRLYTYKTARYTFSVPLAVGAMLAKASDKIINDFLELGETIGILFQIQDDKLDSETNPFTKNDIVGYKQKVLALVQNLTISTHHKNTLYALIDFVITRNK
jgi:geranylgeranyl pyrophosphate synthase